MCEIGAIVRRLEDFLRKSLENCESETTQGFNASSLLESVFSAFLNNNTFFRSENLYEESGPNGSLASGNGSATADPEAFHPTINKLEMVKVVVLIVVILIILLTTCRMVFQLSTRFRPEKNNAQD